MYVDVSIFWRDVLGFSHSSHLVSDGPLAGSSGERIPFVTELMSSVNLPKRASTCCSFFSQNEGLIFCDSDDFLFLWSAISLPSMLYGWHFLVIHCTIGAAAQRIISGPLGCWNLQPHLASLASAVSQDTATTGTVSDLRTFDCTFEERDHPSGKNPGDLCTLFIVHTWSIPADSIIDRT